MRCTPKSSGQCQWVAPTGKDHISPCEGKRSFVQFGGAQTRQTFFVVDKKTKGLSNPQKIWSLNHWPVYE